MTEEKSPFYPLYYGKYLRGIYQALNDTGTYDIIIKTEFRRSYNAAEVEESFFGT